MRGTFFLLLATAMLAFLTSCSLQARITLLNEGPATVAAEVTLAEATQRAWTNLRDLDSTLPVDPMDPALLKKGLGPTSTVSVQASTTKLAFVVSNPSRILPGLTVTPDALDLTLDRQTLRRLVALTSWAESPAVDALIPSAQSKTSEADYQDLLVYLLGSGMSEAAAKMLVSDSLVVLTLVTPRPIRRADGSLSFSDRTVTYRWPLLKVLALEKPLRIHVEF